MATCGFTWDDVGSERLPVNLFMSFVVHAPPGTAVFYERNQGWITSDFLLAQAVDALHTLAWMKTEDAQRKAPLRRPAPVYRPGVTYAEPPPERQTMTAGEYAAKAGLQINWDDD